VAHAEPRSEFDGAQDAGHEDAWQAPIPGLHTFRITDDGVQVFPRVIVAPGETSLPATASPKRTSRERLSLGVKGLDDMLGGGIPSGYPRLTREDLQAARRYADTK
jgi:hypothetical protein